MPETLDPSTRPDIGERRFRGVHWADILLGLSLLFILGSFTSGVAQYFQEPSEVSVPPSALWVGVSLNFLIFILIPSAWLVLTVHGGWAGIRKYIGASGGWSEAAMGSGLGVVLVLVMGGAALLADQFGLAPDDAPIEDLLRNITWPLAIVFSLVAGIGEELLFRGILQRWLRWWGQGIIFGALHFVNAGLFAFILVGTIGLLFGYLRHRGVSLWTLMVAHFVYDIILMAVAISFPDLAGGGPA